MGLLTMINYNPGLNSPSQRCSICIYLYTNSHQTSVLLRLSPSGHEKHQTSVLSLQTYIRVDLICFDLFSHATQTKINQVLQRLTQVRQRNTSTDSDTADVPVQEEPEPLPVLEVQFSYDFIRFYISIYYVYIQIIFIYSCNYFFIFICIIYTTIQMFYIHYKLGFYQISFQIMYYSNIM